MLKDVVVNLSGRASLDFAADYAISIAATFGAHVTGIAFLYEPVIPDATLFAQIARRFDISVVGQAQREQGATDELIIEGALFESGRPVIVVPYIQKSGLTLERVLVCWDGGRTAARAVADAMPFLTRAKAVDLVIVAEERKNDEVTGVRMSEHLARHGAAVSVKRIAKGDLSVQDAILSYAADSSADFMVMGGYGHSRLREFILGGVTRSILNSMTVPVLMSH